MSPSDARADNPQRPHPAGILGHHARPNLVDAHQVRKTVLELRDGKRLVETGDAVAPDSFPPIQPGAGIRSQHAVGLRIPRISGGELDIADAAVEGVAPPGKDGLGTLFRRQPIGIVRPVIGVGRAAQTGNRGPSGFAVRRIGHRSGVVKRSGELLVPQMGQEHNGPIRVHPRQGIGLLTARAVAQRDQHARITTDGQWRKHAVHLMVALQGNADLSKIVLATAPASRLASPRQADHQEGHRQTNNDQDDHHLAQGDASPATTGRHTGSPSRSIRLPTTGPCSAGWNEQRVRAPVRHP